jgi:pimeloyl-ACP methyl ester carboxylesterase
MLFIAQSLSSKFQVITLDWPGFGQSDRLPLNYQSGLYHQFLQNFVNEVVEHPTAVVAAGHAAGYAMHLAQKMPQLFSKIALIAPTWRGPLPAMGVNQPIASSVRQLVRSPILGQALYQMNTTSSFLRLMYRRHVYIDQAKLTPEFMTRKREITQQSGARYAPAAFVTGAIDPVENRTDFLAYFQPLPAPVMVIIGEQAPPKSRTEMDAIAQLPEVHSCVLPGSLGMHEEFGQAVSKEILQFLGTTNS